MLFRSMILNRFFNHYFAEADGDGGDLSGAGEAGANSGADGGSDAGAGAGKPAVPADWPADWRAKMSPDGKHTQTLDRLASPAALFNSYLALRQKQDSGELKPVVAFPTAGTPEDQAAWRKSHDIPEKAEDYAVKFDDGLVIGEVDKPIIDDFLKTAHGVNAAPEQVNGILHWYYELQEKNLVAQEERDTSFLSASEDALRAEWGNEYRPNINAIKGLINTLPESVRDLFSNARLGDGNALLNHPDMARWLAHTARTLNPTATVVPNAGANVAGAIDDEIAGIEKLMRTDRKAYNADQKMQQRLRELYGARERAH